ncbi:Uncharacterised protein [Segatella copri]|nr:Uncharacterised protein [Segatella copri]
MFILFSLLMRPNRLGRNMDGRTADAQRRSNITLETVTHHDEF